MRTKILLFLIVIISLSFSFTPSVEAQGWVGMNSLGPYNPTAAQLAHLAAKDRAARLNMLNYNKLKSEVSATGAVPVYEVYVGKAEQYREPEGAEYKNYCGPTSTQVAIRARTSNVPDRKTVAKAVKFDGTNTWMLHITPYLNKTLNTTWYETGVSGSPERLFRWVKADIDKGYAMVTGVVTKGMPGWGAYRAYHIVTVYGYVIMPPGIQDVLEYVDTGSEYAGHKYKNGGRYFNYEPLDKFWKWVQPNDAQAW